MVEKPETPEAPEAPPEGSTKGNVLPDWSTEPTPAYANMMYAQSFQNEVAIIACDVMPFAGRIRDGTLGARIVASLRLTPLLFLNAVMVLASHWNKIALGYNRSNPEADKLPRFKLIDSEQQLEGLDDVMP